jgi:hypothetical protein
MTSLYIREATEPDLPDISRMYTHPEIESGRVLTLSGANRDL